MAASAAERVKRRMERLGYNQTTAGHAAGVNPSTLSAYFSGRNENMRPDTAEKLAPILKVPLLYFYVDSPAQYMAVRIMDQMPEFRAWPLHQKVAWVLNELYETWSDEFAVSAIAESAGMELDTVEAMLAGKEPMSDHLLNHICRKTGLPLEFFAFRTSAEQGRLPEAYLVVAETAYMLGFEPDILVEMLTMMHKAVRTSKERRGQM